MVRGSEIPWHFIPYPVNSSIQLAKCKHLPQLHSYLSEIWSFTSQRYLVPFPNQLKHNGTIWLLPERQALKSEINQQQTNKQAHNLNPPQKNAAQNIHQPFDSKEHNNTPHINNQTNLSYYQELSAYRYQRHAGAPKAMTNHCEPTKNY